MSSHLGVLIKKMRYFITVHTWTFCPAISCSKAVRPPGGIVNILLPLTSLSCF
jgi:hypothetical protein